MDNNENDSNWEELEELAAKYDTTKTFEENEAINCKVTSAWERVCEKKLREQIELLKQKYAQMGLTFL
jgi:hypothetical protein